MATVNPVEGIEGIGNAARLLHLINVPSVGDVDISTPEKMQRVFSSILSQLDRLNALFGIADANFQTLYTNDGNLNIGPVINSATAAGPTVLGAAADLVTVAPTMLGVSSIIIAVVQVAFVLPANTSSTATFLLKEDSTTLDTKVSAHFNKDLAVADNRTDCITCLGFSTPSAGAHTYALNGAGNANDTVSNMVIGTIELR